MPFPDILHYALSAVMLGVCGAWVFLIKSMLESFARTPYLDRFDRQKHANPKVSVIVPARNEEKFLGRCLDSLIGQDYDNYEVIAVDDSSEDGTASIIRRLAAKDPRVIPVMAGAKPDGWMGKNWACMEGFKKATGELLLFTDADTRHLPNTVSLSVSHLLSFNLDALTVIPRMLALDWWTRVTLPMISTFLHTQFSALKVNDPAKKTGYFFGSFFIIRRQTYRDVGMHEGVRQEIIEDGALGRKVKSGGYKIRMVRGEHLVEAVWARSASTLWNALKRLMVPLFLQSGRTAVGIFVAVLFLLFMPFPFMAYSAASFSDVSAMVLFATSLLASILIYAASAVESKKGLSLGLASAVFAPVGGLVVALSFLAGLLQAKSRNAVSWRGRSYSLKDHAQNAIDI